MRNKQILKKMTLFMAAALCAVVMFQPVSTMAAEGSADPKLLNEEIVSDADLLETEDTLLADTSSEDSVEEAPQTADEETAEAGVDVSNEDGQQALNEDVTLSVSAEEEPEPIEADAVAYRNEAFSDGNHIYFYNIEGGVGSSDMILLESNGRWALIDSGHRYENTIPEKNGKAWAADYAGLSCQVSGKYGSDAMKYMIETLGVDHLDFIIGTHSHSDHIGGIPEIAALMVESEDGSVHSLIDDTTVYFYKMYHHTGAQDDDLGSDTISTSWHNQAYYYQAKQAVKEQGGKLVDISCGISATDGKTVSANQSSNLSVINNSGKFSSVTYQARSASNPYDDRISFQWGDMKIDLYHLFATNGAKNENVNSIVTVLTCSGHKIYMAGDMDTTFRVEQKLAKVIAADYGHFDLVKMSHHGIYDGSNSRDLLDSLQPKMMISTNHWTNLKSSTPGGVYSSVKYYAAKNYGTVFYGVGMSDRMIDVELDGRNLSVFNVKGTGANASVVSAVSCKDSGKIQNGWSQWRDEIYSANVYNWYYFVDSKAVIGWKQIEGKWYHFASDGFLDRGWHQENGKYYYLNEEMKTGWQLIDGEWYYFNANGVMAANAWAKDRVGWCWLGANGKQVKSKWIWSGGAWYYIQSDGYMAANAWAKDSKGWCYLGYDGKQVKDKWAKWRGYWYYIKSNGYMAAGEYASDSKYRYWMDSNGKIASKSGK